MKSELTKTLRCPDSGTPEFVLNIKHGEHWADFELLRVSSYSGDGTVGDTEPYLEGCIKWDGCSHIKTPPSCATHLCGVRDWKLHCKAMEWVYRETLSTMIHHDETEEWDYQPQNS